MATSPPPARPDPADPASLNSLASIAAQVSRLKSRAGLGIAATPLWGRNIAILCDDPDDADAQLLQRAAGELGARVGLVSSSRQGGAADPSPADTARVLGRLYDAVICIDQPPERVAALNAHVDVPVLADVPAQWRALRALDPACGDSPRYLLQVLLTTLCT